MGLLQDILSYKRLYVKERKAKKPLDKLIKGIENKGFFFRAGLKSYPAINIIAEIKRSSPSAGLIVKDFDPEKIAAIYEKSGAAAISVLTDEKYFGGSFEALRAVCKSVKIPVLCKDFIIDDYQIYEAYLCGASAVLLIACILDNSQLQKLKSTADFLGVDSVVEVHSKQDLDKALLVGPEIIGVNNRNLDTLKTDLSVSEQLSGFLPKNTLAVSESGIRSAEDIRRLKKYGINSFLVGENILKNEDISCKIKELIGA